MRRLRAAGLALLAGWVLAGCGGDNAASPTPGGGTNQLSSEVPPASGSGRVITGAEALELYGVDVDKLPTPGPATATPLIWFPARAWVEPSVLPYDPNETINFLPMFSRPELDEEGTWLGDLEAGLEVVLHGVSEDGTVCLVEGPVLQGWTTRGWVACNRLRFTLPPQGRWSDPAFCS